MSEKDPKNATRQARYRERQKEKGFVRYTVWINQEDLMAGLVHGKTARKTFPIPTGRHALSWIMGCHLGQDARAGETAEAKGLTPAVSPEPVKQELRAFTPERALRSPNVRTIPTSTRNRR